MGRLALRTAFLICVVLCIGTAAQIAMHNTTAKQRLDAGTLPINLADKQVFPKDNLWNRDISPAPMDESSDA